MFSSFLPTASSLKFGQNGTSKVRAYLHGQHWSSQLYVLGFPLAIEPIFCSCIQGTSEYQLCAFSACEA
jgi:hypothetical protein